ncbi:hypothetical protein U1Q18_045401, partial [Sarracenia purpurea var. burkii]
ATGGLREVEQAAAVESSGVGGCKTQDSVGIIESTQQRSCRGDFGGGFRRAKKSHGCRRFCAKKKSEIEIGLFLVRRRQISGFAGPVELQATWAEKEKKIKISVQRRGFPTAQLQPAPSLSGGESTGGSGFDCC